MPFPFPFSSLIFVAFFAISSWTMAIQQNSDGSVHQIYCQTEGNSMYMEMDFNVTETDVRVAAIVMPENSMLQMETDCSQLPRGSSEALTSNYVYLNVTCDGNTNLTLIHLECQNCSPKIAYCPHPPPNVSEVKQQIIKQD